MYFKYFMLQEEENDSTDGYQEAEKVKKVTINNVFKPPMNRSNCAVTVNVVTQ